MDLAWKIPGCIRLEVGEPNFPTPAHIVEAAIEALRSGRTKYAPNTGISELREAITTKVHTSNHFEATVDQVTVTAGAVQGLFCTLLALVEPGDRVLLPDPGWPNYSMMAHLLHLGQDYYVLRAENEFLPDLDELERAVTPRTRAIIINSPSNPLGTIIPAEILRGICEFAARHDLYVISDEAYEHVIFEPGFVSPAALGDANRVVSIYSFSKSYAMTGWRVGYVVAPKILSPIIQKLQEPQVSCVNTPSQVAATAALQGPQDVVAEMTATYLHRRNALAKVLAEHEIKHVRPAGAFYAWVSLGDIESPTREFSRRLLLERGVAVAPGDAFGPSGEGWIRLSLATDGKLILEGAARLADFLTEL
jgi:aspartate/methionine/tyrosine aminotransferase